MKKFLFALAALAPLTLAHANSPMKPSVYGTWLTEDARAKVQVDACKHNMQQICGTIVWLKEPLDPDTKQEKLDKHNKTVSFKTRKLIGLENLTSFVQSKGNPNLYEHGHIYNPKDGDTYKAHLTVVDPNTLKVRGYVLMPLLGKNQIWKRTNLD
jgi:uncharacterized protein (DUF2147 family)